MELTQGVRFDTLELSPELLRALLERNIVQSTPVQAGCIPPMLAWRDVIAKAPTGTGKTFAYGIPIVEHIDPEDDSVQAVILAPTRELAIQITDELRVLYAYKPGIRAVCLYGGAPIGRQIDALKKHPQIVVATPGRLSDHMKRRTVRVETAKTVVLDEADRMLDMGFIHDVTRLLDKMNQRKNLGLFRHHLPRGHGHRMGVPAGCRGSYRPGGRAEQARHQAVPHGRELRRQGGGHRQDPERNGL